MDTHGSHVKGGLPTTFYITKKGWRRTDTHLVQKRDAGSPYSTSLKASSSPRTPTGYKKGARRLISYLGKEGTHGRSWFHEKKPAQGENLEELALQRKRRDTQVS